MNHKSTYISNFLHFILVYNISARHQLLETTIGVRQEEKDSYEMVTYLNNCLTPIYLTALILETATVFFYFVVVPHREVTIQPISQICHGNISH